MRRQFSPLIFVSAVLLGASFFARVQALGLDEIQVSSSLNQRLVASIPLTEVTADDLETVSAAVAPNEAFERAGVERAEYLSSLDFQIKNDRGQPRIVITSNQIAREPVLNLLVQARWRGGKILRDYTILLDPIEMAATPAEARPAPAPVIVSAAPVVAVAPVVEAPKPKPAPIIAASEAFYQPQEESKAVPPSKPSSATVTAPMIAPSGASTIVDNTSSYGPVAAGETLWSIAGKVRPSANLSMDQVVLALTEANPLVIQRGTTVNKGATLKVPSAERMQATAAAEATKRLADLRADRALPAIRKPDVTPQLSVAKPAEPPPAKLAKKPAPVLSTPAKPQSTVAAPAAVLPAASAPAVAVASAEKPVEAVAPPPVTASADVVQTGSATAPADAAAPAQLEPAAPATASLAQRLPDESSDEDSLTAFYQPLALAIAVLLLVAGVFVLAKRRRKANALSQKFTDFAVPGLAGGTVSKNAGHAPTPFGDTAAFTSTQILAMRTGPVEDSTQQITQQMGRQSTQKLEAQGTDFGATLVLDPQTMASLKDSAKTSAVDGKSADTDFDRTMQVDVDTLNIDLNDNDPLAEADFHLAYGLYDEAILLLQTAVAQNPGRVELQSKLVETYFTAGRAIEFQEIAGTLQSKLTPAEWSKIAIMGAQICPDVALFKSARDGMLVTDTDFDLAFDEPAPQEESPKPETSKSEDASVIDFDLDSAMSQLTEAPVTEVQSSEQSLDFMLSEISSPAVIDDSHGADKNVIEFDLGSPELDIGIPALADPEIKEPKKNSDGLDVDSLGFDLHELEFSITAGNASHGASGNDFNTKLDLARAYVEMGDNDMARSLLQEVQLLGSEHQQQEAASLLQRLPA